MIVAKQLQYYILNASKCSKQLAITRFIGYVDLMIFGCCVYKMVCFGGCVFENRLVDYHYVWQN